nr:hypothetical protein [uncultured Ruminococcus sp.]
MKLNKKNIVTGGVAVSLAAMMLIGGGTFAYLKDNADPVTNNFKTNRVTVELSETTGNEYNIIPGTEEDKDPTVTVTNTVDAYVFVTITDATDGLVGFQMADGWTKLVGHDNVYYREVSANADVKKFPVLKGNKVTYDKAIENSDMMENGDLKAGVALTFDAAAIQKDPFASVAEAYAAKDAVVVRSDEDLDAAIEAGEPVVLAANVEIDGRKLNAATDVDMNLNNKTLTVSAPNSIDVSDGKTLNLENGTVNISGGAPNTAAILVGENGSATVKNVEMNLGDQSLLVDQSVNNAEFNIIDSEIYADPYCLSTNASNNQTGAGVVVNIKNSVLKTSQNDSTAVLFNIPGTLNIEDSTLEGGRQGLIVRCGTANVKNSDIKSRAASTDDFFDKYIDSKWGSGNEVPVAALVVGNRSNASSYPFDATCTLENTTLTISGKTPVYAAAYNGRTTTVNGVASESVTVSKDATSSVVVNE